MDKVRKVLKSGKVVRCLCGSQPTCDEVKGLPQPGEGVLDALLRLLELMDPLVGGTVMGDVGGEPPVSKEEAPLDEGAVVRVARVDECPEPGGEGPDEQIVVIAGGSIEGG